MSTTTRSVFLHARRLLICVGSGFLIGALIGAVGVLVFWFPSAMIEFAQHPHYVDPRAVVLSWCATWGVGLGLIGAVIGMTGFAVSLIPVGRTEPHQLTAPEE